MREGHDVGEYCPEYCPWTYALGFLGLNRCRNILAPNARNGAPGQGQVRPPPNDRILTLGALVSDDLGLVATQRLMKRCDLGFGARNKGASPYV